MNARLMLCAALAVLSSCGTPPREDIAAERAALDMVTGAVLDRPGGPVDVSWVAYLAADERLSQEERRRFADFIASWKQRVEAGEALLRESGR